MWHRRQGSAQRVIHPFGRRKLLVNQDAERKLSSGNSEKKADFLV
jgi:hypothetical protein